MLYKSLVSSFSLLVCLWYFFPYHTSGQEIPYKNIVRVNNPSSMGSGVILSITPPIVISCAHVIDSPSTPPVITVSSGNAFQSSILYMDRTQDFSVLLLDNQSSNDPNITLESLNLPQIKIAKNRPTSNDTLVFAGCGGSGNIISREGTFHTYSPRNYQDNFIKINGQHIPRQGDSGGPVFILNNSTSEYEFVGPLWGFQLDGPYRFTMASSLQATQYHLTQCFNGVGDQSNRPFIRRPSGNPRIPKIPGNNDEDVPIVNNRPRNPFDGSADDAPKVNTPPTQDLAPQINVQQYDDTTLKALLDLHKTELEAFKASIDEFKASNDARLVAIEDNNSSIQELLVNQNKLNSDIQQSLINLESRLNVVTVPSEKEPPSTNSTNQNERVPAYFDIVPKVKSTK